MLLGHYGIALALKKVAPRTSLPVLVMAANFLDLLWPVFLLLGWENVSIVPGITALSPFDFTYYPFSHSLLATMAWSVVVGSVYFVATRYARGSMIIACTVLSHWVLDALVHRPDLPIGFGDTRVIGLGLWDSLGMTLVLEFGILFTGLYLYTRTTEPKDQLGRYALGALVATLLAIYATTLIGPPPPSTRMIAYAGNASWLFVLWSYGIERHRQPRTNPQLT